MAKTSMPKNPGRGLVNPTVTARKLATPAAKTHAPQKTFNTHIPEPRVQRLVSLIVVVCFVAFEVWLWARRSK